MKLKKICAGAAAAVMAVSCFSVAAFADEADYSYSRSVEANENKSHPTDAALLLFPAAAAVAGVASGLIINKKRKLSH